MIQLALKMLIGNRASLVGAIFGIFLATLLISQQSAIFLGLISRSYRMLTDIPAPEIWVMDKATESDERVRLLPQGNIDVVRSVKGIEWATPINVMYIPMVTESGLFQIAQMVGIDDATLIGAPQHIVEGSASALRKEGGIIVDIYSAKGVLATTHPDGTKTPLSLGSEVEINGHRAIVVALSRITQGFYPQPIIFTSLSSYRLFTSQKEGVSFIAAKATEGAHLQAICDAIDAYPGLLALTKESFQWRIIETFLKTGILINFGLSVALGFIVGFSIAGQIFYTMTLENLMYYALMKSLGGTKKMILHMIIAQALLIGVVGFCLGIAVTAVWGMAIKETTLAFLFPWQLFVFTFAVVLLICLLSAAISIRKVFKTDPKTLMGS